MNNFTGLNKKKYFFQLLSRYLDNSFINEEKELLKLFYSINSCQQCGSVLKGDFFYPGLNPRSNLLVLLDPFYLYENYHVEDESKINELFYKILNSINITIKDIYLTYSIKCILKKDFFKNKEIDKKYFLKELEIIKPKDILIFGRYAHELFFSDLDKVEYNNIADPYKIFGYRLFFASNPVEIFYDSSLKKPVWEFLKFFRKTVLKPCL